jgi:hypothetical protein
LAEAARARAKGHLGRDAFMDEDAAPVRVDPSRSIEELMRRIQDKEQAGGPCRVPRFELRKGGESTDAPEEA